MSGTLDSPAATPSGVPAGWLGPARLFPIEPRQRLTQSDADDAGRSNFRKGIGSDCHKMRKTPE